MSAGKVCRLCLAIDAHVPVIAGSPLQTLYEKLTEVSLCSPHRPVVACYVCYSQLRKCYNLMVRSVRADEVLTQILRRGEVVEEELVAMIHQYRPGNGLSITPTELMSTTSTVENLINADTIENPVTSQNTGEIVTDERLNRSEDQTAIETLHEHLSDIESRGLMNNVKQEVLERAVDNESSEVTVGDDTKHKGEEQHTERLKNEKDTRQKELEGAQDLISKGVAPSNRCNQTHEKTQDKTTLTPDENNILGRLRKRSGILEEDTSSRNTGSYSLRSTKEVVELSTKTEKNEDTSAMEEDLANSSSILTEIFICNDCNNVFDNKNLLIKHIENHNIDKRTSNRTRVEESSHQRTPLRKQRPLRTVVINKRTETFSGMIESDNNMCKEKLVAKKSLKKRRTNTSKKPSECEICQVKFTANFDIKRHLKSHTDERPFKCNVCEAKFKQKFHLQRHLLTHTGDSPFECYLCERKFKQKANLNKHLRNHIDDKGPFECVLCQVQFKEKNYWKSHQRMHAREKRMRMKFNKDC